MKILYICAELDCSSSVFALLCMMTKLCSWKYNSESHSHHSSGVSIYTQCCSHNLVMVT